MNQHASRPVAQGFPLHRRMHGPIHPAGPRTTQLRPSNPLVMIDGGRSHFKSQIPIRTGLAQPSQQALLHAQALEQRRQLLASTSQSSASTTTLRTSAGGQQSIEVAFKVYEDRLQLYFKDFRTMCSRLIMQEREEKDKWHSLCLKLMKERDAARQRVSALMSERETQLSSQASSSTNEQLAFKTSKRTRDDESGSVVQELPCRSSPVESRPIRSLRSSPVPSPPGSPSGFLYNSSTSIDSSSLPSSSSSPPPPSPNTTDPPMSATPLTPSSPSVNIITFNPPRSPNDKTCFDVFGVIDIPETRPVKRRKSYDSSLPDKKTVQTTEGGDSSGSSQSDTEVRASPCPFSISHTDIMYIPMKGRLFCRACLLDKTTNPSSNHSPKTFPTNVFWDELRDHCVKEHPVACADVAGLSRAALNELRRRLYNNI